jgi:hypothetical protein
MENKMKILQARLKEIVATSIVLDELYDFEKDWLSASAIIENAKRKLVVQLKNAYHERIATLSMDDIVFKVTD